MFNSFDTYVASTTQQERQKFANLLEDCSFKGKGKREYTSKRKSQEAARENLIDLLIAEGVLDPSLKGQKFGKTGAVMCCHLCSCHSGDNDGPVCVNPHHSYLGTAKENYQDINPNTQLSAQESAKLAKNTPESKDKASQSQKLAWVERKARLLQHKKD